MSTHPALDLALPSTFPAEIEDLVIDELRRDVQTLRQCALTCSGWLPRSRHHLFFSVQLRTIRQLFSLCSAITEYSHLRPLVRSVSLEATTVRPDSEHLTEITPIPLLNLLPNMTRWFILGAPVYNAKETMKDTENMEGHPPQGGAVVDTNRDWRRRRPYQAAPPCHRMALACLRRYSITIQELYLRRVSFPTSMDCARLILSFPALRSLKCERIFVES